MTSKCIHELKIHPIQFEAVMTGKKHHEFRRDDRGFKVGDHLILREFMPCTICGGSGRQWASGDKDDCDCTVTNNPKGVYSGRMVKRVITWITQCREWGGSDGFVCLSIMKD